MKFTPLLCLILIGNVFSLHGMVLTEEHPEVALRMIENELSLLRMRKIQMPVQQAPRISRVLSDSDINVASAECSICMEEYTQEKPLIKLLCDPERKISHEFCKVCIEDWLKKENNCPTCRRPIVSHESSLINVLKLSWIFQLFSCGYCPLEPREG